MLKPLILFVLTIAIVISGRLFDPGNLFEFTRLKTFDFYNRLLPRVPPENRPVFIADIDEKSLAEFGQWPWSRDTLARLVDALRDYETKAVGLDLLLSEPDRIPPELAAERAFGVSEEDRNTIKEAESTELILANSMRKHRVVIAQSVLRADQATRPISEASKETSVKSYRLNNGATVETLHESLWTYPTYLPNVELLEKAAASRGFINISPEKDGIVRRIPLILKAANVLKPAFALELLRVAKRGQSLLVLADLGGVSALGVNMPGEGSIIIPVDSNSRLWVNFAKPGKRTDATATMKLYYSVSDIIHKRIPKNDLLGRIALVGTSAIGLKDTHRSAITPYLPGVEVHANIIETILDGQTLSRPKTSTLFELGLATVLGFVGLMAAQRLKPTYGLGVVWASGVGVAAYSWFEFSQNLILSDATFPLVTMFSVYAVFAFADYRKADKARQM